MFFLSVCLLHGRRSVSYTEKCLLHSKCLLLRTVFPVRVFLHFAVKLEGNTWTVKETLVPAKTLHFDLSLPVKLSSDREG